MTVRQHHRQDSGAFTLIELLAAIGILMLIVTMVGIVFTESDRAWTLGTNRSDVNLEGRAALGMLAHDLQYAIAYSNSAPYYRINFVARPEPGVSSGAPYSYGFPNDSLCFVSLQNDSSDDNRAVREMFYYVREMPEDSSRFELVRSYWDEEIESDYQYHCYYDTTWCDRRPSDTAHFIARNVSGFAVYSYENNGRVAYSYDSTSPASSNRLPEYVDVCLELLPDRQARQAGRLSGVALTNFVSRNAMRYATRVYFHNRDGYKER